MTSAIAPPDPVPCRRCSTPNPADAQVCRECRSFLAGNQLSKAHGARAGRSLAAATSDALAELQSALAGGPGLEARYAHALALTAQAIARARLLADYLADRGLWDSRGRIRPQAKTLAEAEGAALKWLSALGAT